MGGPGSGRRKGSVNKKGSVAGDAVIRKMRGEVAAGRKGKSYGSDKSLSLRAARAASNDVRSLSKLKEKAPSSIKGTINTAIRESKRAATKAKSSAKTGRKY